MDREIPLWRTLVATRCSGTIFTVGDNAYERGTRSEFLNCYRPTWGRYKARTKPTPGNHDYYTSGASGYFNYFGAAAGRSDRGYYSYNRGRWHIVALNSNCEKVGGCGSTSRQVRWLKADLKANPRKCTLAYFHHPLFSSGQHGGASIVKPLWQTLYAARADVIVSGHDHDYERFGRQDPNGKADSARGIRQFVVGTGGKELRRFKSIRPNSQRRNSRTPGVLKLTLHPRSYVWKFVPVAGRQFTDSGRTLCR